MDLPLLQPNFNDPVEAWGWLFDHPLFFFAGERKDHCDPGFTEALDFYCYKEDDGTPAWWLEVGPFTDPTDQWERNVAQYRMYGIPGHNPDLDTRGDTFETALSQLAQSVYDKFGSYPEYRFCSHCLKNRPAGPTDSKAEWFCTPVCEEHGRVALVVTDGRWVPPSEQFDCEHWRH